MINGVVAHVELENEIVEWTSSIANSLALICNTAHKRCCLWRDVKAMPFLYWLYFSAADP